MSIQCISRVWANSQASGGDLLLLLAIADYADDDGFCWPGIEALAQKARIKPRQVMRHTKTLERQGEIVVIHRRARGNLYILKTAATREQLQRAAARAEKFDAELTERVKLSLFGAGPAAANMSSATHESVTDDTLNVSPETLKSDTAASHDPSLSVIEPSEEPSFTPPQAAENPPADPGPAACPPSVTVPSGRRGRGGHPLDSERTRSGGLGEPPDAWLAESRIVDPGNGEIAEIAPIPADPVLHAVQVLRRAERAENWADPPDAGGADDYAGEPLTAFCELLGIQPDDLPAKQRRQWAKPLRKLGEAWGVGPPQLAACLRAMPDSDIGWKVKSYSTPYAQGFQSDLEGIIARVLAGGLGVNSDGRKVISA